MTGKATIISAIYGKPAYWRRNLGLVAALNPDADWDWIAVDNSDEPVLEDAGGPNVRLLRGPPNPRVRDGGSLHHAMGLEIGLAAADSRFVLIMDPDFFVMRRGWIEAVLAHMEDEGLALFGAPWNPRWFYEWRGFPSVHFLVVDTDHIPRDALAEALRPHIEGDRWWKLVSERLPLPTAVRDTLMIGRCRDTGYLLREQFGHESCEMLVPHYVLPDVPRVRWERWLPPGLRIYPGADVAYTARSVLREHLPRAWERRWEEFFWQDAPFGFHLRGVGRFQSGDAHDDDRALLEVLMDDFGAGRAPWWP